jgi:Flp pilus assembly protein TadD
MAAGDDRQADSPREGPNRETSKRRSRQQRQLDFELEFLGQILDRDPYYPDALAVHAANLANDGQYARAMQMDRRLVRLQPDRPIPWYNLACSYALLGMVDPAFAALQRAVDLGYRHIRHLCRDPDLAALRRDPRFPRLLRRTAGTESVDR